MKSWKQVTNPAHIAAEMTARRLTLRAAAQAAGVSPTTIARAASKRQKVTFAVADKLKAVFGAKAVVSQAYEVIKCTSERADDVVNALLDAKEREGYELTSLAYWEGKDDVQLTFEKPAEV